MKIGIFLSIFLALANAQETPPLVKTPAGQYKGIITQSDSGSKVYAFKGIKYGTVPKRFAEPEELWSWMPAWTVNDATNFGADCKQFDGVLKMIKGEEQCLFLNIYSKNLNPSANLPIIFWIHGGAFVYGSGSAYDPSFLLNEDVVVVTINYRLGPLGFMNAGVKDMAGNQGFKDQILALKWVQKNIANFGGNKDLVTIYGESAGSASVSYLVLSPAARGLFSRAIAHSGTNYSPWAYMEEPEAVAKKYAQEFDCPTKNVDAMVECLSSLDSGVLLEPMEHALNVHPSNDKPNFGFGGSVERGYISERAFLTEEPDAIYEKGLFNPVPLMVGGNIKEGAFFGTVDLLNDPNLLSFWNAGGWESYLPKMMQFKKSVVGQCRLVNSFWEQYFPGLDEIGQPQKDELDAMYSDIIIFSGVQRTVQRHSTASAPTYAFQFSIKGDNSIQQKYQFQYPLMPPLQDPLYDPTHVDDLQYFFKNQAFHRATEKFKRDSERLVKLWVSFARDGKPTQIWGDSVQEWPEFDPENPKWIDINEEIMEVEESELFGTRMSFWKEFYDKIY